METLNYNHLRYFWAVARRGNLRQASDDLHLTPQTLSTQIQTLEENCGEQLFDRVGRRLVLTEAGRVALKYAEEIFSLGRDFMDAFTGRSEERPLRLLIGIADVLPKMVAERLIAPALELERPVRVVCRETNPNALLADLAVHRIDVVLSDVPLSHSINVRAFNHKLGECGVTFMAAERLADRYRKNFPISLDKAPFLLPTDDTALRRSLEQWFEDRSIHPRIIGEFQDSALMKAFGQVGTGVFVAPSVIEKEVERQYKTKIIGRAEGIVERFYAISAEKRIHHPAVAAICERARQDLFA